MSNQQAQQGGREGRLKERVVAKKKEEYQEYGQSIGALAKQYTTPNPDALMKPSRRATSRCRLGKGQLRWWSGTT